MTSDTIPIAGKISTYTSGCAKNQNKCCQRTAFPPPATAEATPLTTSPDGMKKLEPSKRSDNCKTPAAMSGGNARRRRKEVTNCAHTKNGRRKKESPLARSCTTVVIKLMEPKSEELIKNTMPMSHHVCPPEAMTESGGYDVHPDCAAPPGTKKLASITTPPIK